MPQVTLWTLFVADCRDDSDLLAAYRALLSPEELARMNRFVFERDRLRHLVSRALVRVVLGRALGVAPQALVFGEGPQGKPTLLGADGTPVRGLSFNLAHTSDMAVLAVMDTSADPDAPERMDVGVDVETTERPAPLEVASHQFAPTEVQGLHALAAGDAQHERFWTLWTLKESLIKATGLGLSTPLARFGFLLDGDGIGLHCEPGTAEAAQPWWFGVWRPSARHMAALCVALPSPAACAPPVQAIRIVPLRSETPLSLDFLRRSAPCSVITAP